jgi:DNA modification methylase
LIPARVALAAQADGWWVRSDIIWSKPNPMPESVTDRPTDAYEHIFMLTKSSRYYWDAAAVRENLAESSIERLSQDVENQNGSDRVPGKTNGNMKAVARGGWNGSKFTDKRDVDTKPNLGMGPRNEMPGRNIRNIWTFPTAPYKGAHFATFPPEMVIRCLQAATKSGDMVLDPFGGSGTVGEVAFNMGRRFVLCDLAYQELQRERIPPMHGMLTYA